MVLLGKLGKQLVNTGEHLAAKEADISWETRVKRGVNMRTEFGTLQKMIMLLHY